MIQSALSGQIIGAFYQVYHVLGYGFLEKVYENAMMIELEKRGLFTQQQQNIKVLYDNEVVGDYYADIIVENAIILELKAADTISPDHECQLINYLKATDKEIGLLFNFGKTPQFSRKVYSNNRKEWYLGRR